MRPDDLILVAIVNNRRDFEIVRSQSWYRIPARTAPPAIEGVQWLAFYQTRAFDDERWAIRYYAPLRGHELVRRRDLLPGESEHPRADEPYFKLQLGPLQRRETPIPSLRWRRITFFYTTGDRFQAAQEINDLFITGPAAEGLFVTLKEAGLAPERLWPVREQGIEYRLDLAVLCREGLVAIAVGDAPAPVGVLRFSEAELAVDLAGCLAAVRVAVAEQGGLVQGGTIT
jgi:hypothetical protein